MYTVKKQGKKQGKTWGVYFGRELLWGVYFGRELVEGGFFSRDAAQDCCDEWNRAAQHAARH